MARRRNLLPRACAVAAVGLYAELDRLSGMIEHIVNRADECSSAFLSVEFSMWTPAWRGQISWTFGKGDELYERNCRAQVMQAVVDDMLRRRRIVVDELAKLGFTEK